MPGVLSSIFDARDDDGSQHESTVTTVEGGGDFAVHQDVGVDAGLTYQDAEGTTHSWQFENDVGVHADVGAAVTAVLLTDDSVS
jgi:hypothetical protein